MKTKTTFFQKTFSSFLMLMIFGLFSSNISTAQSISPDNWEFEDFDSAEDLETIITWGSATEVERVYINYGEDEEDFDFNVYNDNGTTANMTMYLPAKSTNSQKSTPLVLNGFVDFNVGPSASFSITILEGDWIVIIWVYDQDDSWNIEGAEVYFHELDQTHYTNLDGEIAIELDEGNYTLDISADGYVDIFNHNINVFYDIGGVDFNIPMEKLPQSNPYVMNSNPGTGEQDVDVYSNITLNFDRDIAEGSAGTAFDNIQLLDQFDNLWQINDIQIEEGNQLVIYPNHPLNYGASYTLHIPNFAVVDAADHENQMAQDYFLSFTTDDGIYYYPWIEPETQYFSISEPANAEFSIDWGSESEIEKIYMYWWGEDEEYYETELTENTDYEIVGDMLIFYQSFITDANPEQEPGEKLEFRVEFSETAHSYIEIRYVYTFLPYLSPDVMVYDLTNPGDIITNIIFASAESIIEIRDSQGTLDDYEIVGSWLIISEDYLADNLNAVDDEIELEIIFNTLDDAELTITAVQTGITDATVDPVFASVNGNDPVEYIEHTITWNSATEVTELWVYFNEYAQMSSFEYPMYEVIPIDANTATLRIPVGEGGDKSLSAGKMLKAMDYQYITLEVVFDFGAPANILMTYTYEYYEVFIEQFPWHGGWVEGAWTHGVGEEVVLTAHPDPDYQFIKWVLEDDTEITDNPYTFEMPNSDVYISAYFLADFLEVLETSPNWDQQNVDINSSIYITYNRNIQEGAEPNGFDDIIFEKQGGMHLDRSISIDGSMLIITPDQPMEGHTTYNVIIPNHTVADADDASNILDHEFFLSFTTGSEEYFPPDISPNMQIFSLMEPENVSFMINWGSETFINEVSHFYMEDDIMQFIYLEENIDFFVEEDFLTISNDFILGLNPEVYNELDFNINFGSGYDIAVSIMVIPTTKPHINPSTATYDLSNPGDVNTSIVFMMAEELLAVSNGANTLVPETDYTLNGSWLFIKDSYLSNELTAVDDEIVLTLLFDTSDEVEFTITAVESGITNATIDPTEMTVYGSDIPEYVDITVTWNDANSVEDLYIIVVSEGYTEEFPFDAYEVTPINSETANLRVFLGEEKSTQYIFVTIIINFDIGGSSNFYLTIIDEYYEVIANVVPEDAGWVDGAWTYNPGQEVTLTANSQTSLVFHNWRIDGVVVSSDSPYIFEMPNEDVYITAHFISDDVTPYTLTLLVEPEEAGTVSGGGDFIYDENVTISASPNTGFAFVNWTSPDETVVSEDNPYTFNMPDNDYTLIANFIDVSNIEIDRAEQFNVYPNPFSNILYFSNAHEINKVRFVNIAGQIVSEIKLNSEENINTSRLPNGFYMIIIETFEGDRIIKKITKY
jgi:hypothetical protein